MLNLLLARENIMRYVRVRVPVLRGDIPVPCNNIPKSRVHHCIIPHGTSIVVLTIGYHAGGSLTQVVDEKCQIRAADAPEGVTQLADLAYIGHFWLL